jgi:hypothetical protein
MPDALGTGGGMQENPFMLIIVHNCQTFAA